MKTVQDCLALVLLAGLAGCGGGSSNNSSSMTPPPAALTTTSPVNAPATVVLGGGGSVTGADILVPVAATPVTNAEVLGVSLTPTGGSAFNVGDIVHQGATAASVLLFGPGLSNNMQVSISGPPDITIVPGSLISIQSTGNPPVPGIEFQVAVSASADLGARTVIMQSPNNDVTTFTGGLEVVP